MHPLIVVAGPLLTDTVGGGGGCDTVSAEAVAVPLDWPAVSVRWAVMVSVSL